MIHAIVEWLVYWVACFWPGEPFRICQVIIFP